MSLKVLHISSERSWRGGEQQIAYLITELQSHGVHNEVLCQQGSEFEKYCESNSINYHTTQFSGLKGFSKGAKVLKKISKEFDLIHLHTSKGHTVAFYSYLRGCRAKFVLSRRVDFVPGSSLFTRWKYTFKGIKKILCVSEAIRNIMINYLGEKYEDACVTVHSGVDLDKFKSTDELDLKKQYKIDPATFIIGNTSALADHKDYYTFIDTAYLIIQSGFKCKFFILGDGPLEDEIKKYCYSQGIGDHVIFTGFVSNPIEYLRNFDLFLITSKTEGLGTSIIDAFANDIPVVATNAGGIPELVINEQTGLLCDVKDSNHLTEAVLRLASDNELKQRLITNAKAHIKNFTKEETAKKTLKIYQEIV
ncbi:glycosyltransferase family 4 protein [Fulvivirga lutea]|uniref:Glycosyltransferase family 4 protein n=1 Tax=Fulvivirga lutea TaxID=2810512 RepID=A0A974WEW2_9BACT|nr:glycosyltransferase family 4 protein [Fulvivirga lutea]QSE96379.1 glycosyltransferase family 4 protein [Fulvivirga lutea]